MTTINIDEIFESHRVCDGVTLYRDFLAEIERIVEDEGPWKAIDYYLSIAPHERPESEHLLVTARRLIVSSQSENGGNLLPLYLLEPRTFQTSAGCDSDKENTSYEIAKILTENGDHEHALQIFENLSNSASIQTSIRYMCRMNVAVCHQNMGNHDKAIHHLLDIRDAAIVGELKGKSSAVLHYFYKYKATLLRRLGHKSEALKLIKQSMAFYETHNVCFSLGFYHYANCNFEESIRLYDRCLELLGNRSEEFYLIHLYRALADIALRASENPGIPFTGFHSDTMEDLERFRNAAEKYGNFKNDVNSFLVDIVQKLSSKMAVDPDHFIRQIGRLVQNSEIVDVMRRDLIVVLKYFNATKLIDVAKEELDTLANRFRRRELELAGTYTQQKLFGISVCLDIRSSAVTLYSDPEKFTDQFDYLKERIARFLAESFDEIRNTGDGFLLTRFLQSTIDVVQDTEVYCDVLVGVRQLHEDIAAHRNFNVGIGLAFGDITISRLEHDQSNQQVASGRAQMLATRMCELAKPRGVVCYVGELNRQKIQDCGYFTFRERGHKSEEIGEETLLISEEVNWLVLKHRSPFRYVSAPFDPDNEDRLFIDYGGNCSFACLYCFSRGKSLNKGADCTGAIAELNQLSQLGELARPYLLSLGCYNDPLLSNTKTTLKMIDELLCWCSSRSERHVIQFATKAPTVQLLEVAEAAETKCQNLGIDGVRLTIMVSITSFRHMETIDIGRRLKDLDHDALLGACKRFKHVAIVPYVKPFLSGITDRDEQLFKFLSGFEVVVTGYPYWSRRLMNSMARWCIENGQSELLPKYNFFKRHDESLPLIHPHLSSEPLVTVDDRSALKSFCVRLAGIDTLSVFYTSPCAVAHICSTSCYTRIGERLDLKDDLCHGKDESDLAGECPNIACKWHSKFQNSRV